MEADNTIHAEVIEGRPYVDNTIQAEPIEGRPYPNYHAARIRDPGDFVNIVVLQTLPNGIMIYGGRLKSDPNGSTKPQAYRFPKSKFTVAQAKKWLKDHNIKYISFEPASGKSSEENEEMEERAVQREERVMKFDQAELRIEGDDGQRRLVGYAAKYNVKADLGYFIEKIKPGSFDEVLKTSDSRALKNHDPNLLLGRESSKTLRLSSNSVGLHFEIDVPDTTTGRDTMEEIRRGDLNGCSFAFHVGEDEWKHKENEPSERTIIRVDRLYDVGPVTFPAYEQTSVAVRSLEPIKEDSLTADVGEKEQEMSEDRKRELRRKYHESKRMIAHNRPAEV